MSKKKTNTNKKKHPRILIGIPTNGTVTAMCMLSIARTMRDYKGEIEIYHARSSNLVMNRHEIVANAWEQKADYIYWVDSDQGFPPFALDWFIKDNVPVVAANVTRKTIPPVPCAYIETDDYVGPLYTEEADEGIQQVKHVGMGLMLTHISVFNKISEDPPAFCFEPTEDGLRVMGEDVYFCRQCEKHDIPVYVDHDVSKLVVHIGTLGFTTRHALAGRNIKKRMAAGEVEIEFDPEDVAPLKNGKQEQEKEQPHA